MYILGINPADNYPASLESPIPHAPGTRGLDAQGREYVFQTIVSAVVAGELYMLALGAAIGPTILTTGAALYNRQVGGACSSFAALAAGTGFWCQVKGNSFVGVKTSEAVAINVPLYTTATSGATNDLATSSNLIRGLTLTTAAGGAVAAAAALFNWPLIGTVGDLDTIGAS
jgi:hypothetical protein